MIRSHGDILGDTALDILVDIGQYSPTSVFAIADRLCLTPRAVRWHLDKLPLSGRVTVAAISVGRQPRLWEVHFAFDIGQHFVI